MKKPESFINQIDKIEIIGIISLLLGLFFFLSSCEKFWKFGKEINSEENINIEIANSSECKDFSREPDYPPNQECVYYESDENGYLILSHINTPFNCCPKSFDADIKLSENQITIIESEESQECKCLCLYNLKYHITKLKPGNYKLRIQNPYIPDSLSIMGEINIGNGQNAGSFCIHRNVYPFKQITNEPKGERLSYDGCKQFKKNTTNTSQTCVEWTFSENKLSIKHINAAYNCCFEDLKTDFYFSNDTLRIVTKDINGMCDCECLYDINYQVKNLPAKSFVVYIQDQRKDEDQPIEFTLNIKKQPSGKVCFKRTGYPWN